MNGDQILKIKKIIRVKFKNIIKNQAKWTNIINMVKF